MWRSSITIVAVVSALALSGCASMSAEECVTADWRTIGFEDGARGMTPDSIARHRKACAKAGVTADQAAYERGRQDGLGEFCRPQRGYDFGRAGGHYAGVCPRDLEDEFVLAYEDGRRYYDLEQGVRSTERELGRIDSELQSARDDLASGEAQLIDGGGSVEERSRIVTDNRELAQRIGELENARAALLVELGERREALRHYSASNY